MSAQTRRFTRHFRWFHPVGDAAFGFARVGLPVPAHLSGMDDHSSDVGLEPVLTTSQLAAHLGVPVQTIHDLRYAGGGPNGFRVGRELRYRVSEVRSWLSRLEADQLARRSRTTPTQAARP